MAKRNHDSDDDSQEDSDQSEQQHQRKQRNQSNQQSSNQKRSRVNSSSEPEDNNNKSRKTNKDTNGKDNGKGKAAEVSDDEDEEENEEEEEAMRENVEKMRKSTKTNGSIAESGVIDRVELHNFMCHKYVQVSFGPQINFLVGHNGSGKSAVLTGITMALGGNARSTNRASKGSGLVSTSGNATYAICAVRLKNKGANAYNHAKYGDFITVERRINLDATGSYKIKNSSDKTVDSRKAVLDAILDHFNIQVDNPMTVLTQDQSRQFLASSSAYDKYNFFLKGTQLAQLTEEYEIIRANTESMVSTLESKKAVIPDLKEAYKAAKARASDAEAAIGQKDSIEKLKHELAWSYVAEIQSTVDDGNNEVEKQTRVLSKIQAALDTYQENELAARDTVASLDEAIAEFEPNRETEAQLEDLKAKIKHNADRMKATNNQVREMNTTILSMQDSIANYDQQIEAEQSKLARDVQSERQALITQIEDLHNENGKLAIQASKARNDSEDVQEQTNSKFTELADIKQAIIDKNSHQETTKGRLTNIRNVGNNSLQAYHSKMPALVQAIKSQSWKVTPIGPIGTCIKLKEQKWSRVLESFFAETLNGFIVQDHDDYTKLNNLKQRIGCPVPVIKRSSESKFALNEPDSNFITVFRVLEISDPLVLAVLLTDKYMERSVLVPLRPEGDKVMRGNPRNVISCFSADMYRLGGTNGGSSSIVMESWKGGSRLSSDNSEIIASYQDEIAETDKALNELKRNKAELDNYLGKADRERQKFNTLARSTNSSIARNNAKIANLTGLIREEEPSNLAAIQAAKEEAEAELASTNNQFAQLKAQRAKLGLDAKPWVDEERAIIDQMNTSSKLEAKLREKHANAHQVRMEQQSNVEQYKKKLEAQNKMVVRFQAQTDEILPELALRTEQASSICERPNNPKIKASKKLKNEIEALERSLKDREKRQGATFEEIVAELAIRKNAASIAVAAVRDLGKLIAVFEAAYDQRIQRWDSFRTTISGRAKMQFAYHLSSRGFTGKLQFDHTKLKLNLRVVTDATKAGQRNSLKDAKSLSGGEKSFSTICLLLTMWEAVGCPIRCLDEFDVFMDAVNRRISMKMIVDTAKSANATQFILITPQSTTGEAIWGPEVRVSRMSDPERNQGTLSMGK